MARSSGLRCPICKADTNGSGAPFKSEWAVACHIAGSIQAGDQMHRVWVRRVCPEAAGTGFGLAEGILLEVTAAIEHEFKPPRPIGFTSGKN